MTILRTCHNSRTPRKGVSQNLVQPLLSILSSKRTNDEISSEMTELLGFDDLELIMNVLADRATINAEVH